MRTLIGRAPPRNVPYDEVDITITLYLRVRVKAKPADRATAGRVGHSEKG
jgi:hypothetical protein